MLFGAILLATALTAPVQEVKESDLLEEVVKEADLLDEEIVLSDGEFLLDDEDDSLAENSFTE